MGFIADYRNAFLFDLETGSLKSRRSSILSLSYGRGEDLKTSHVDPVAGSFVSDWSQANVLRPAAGAKRIPESEAIRSFITTLKGLPADTTLAGWNIGYNEYSGFDIPFLAARARRYGLEEELLSNLRKFNVRDLGQEFLVGTAVKLRKSFLELGEEKFFEKVDSELWKQMEPFAKQAAFFEAKGASVAEIARKMNQRVEGKWMVAGWQQGAAFEMLLGSRQTGAHQSEEDVRALLKMAGGEAPEDFAESWNKAALPRRLESQAKWAVRRGEEIPWESILERAERYGVGSESTRLIKQSEPFFIERGVNWAEETGVEKGLRFAKRNWRLLGAAAAGLGLLWMVEPLSGFGTSSEADDIRSGVSISGIRSSPVQPLQTDFGSPWKGPVVSGLLSEFFSGATPWQFNTIMGMSEAGMTAGIRKGMTPFGSGFLKRMWEGFTRFLGGVKGRIGVWRMKRAIAREGGAIILSPGMAGRLNQYRTNIKGLTVPTEYSSLFLQRMTEVGPITAHETKELAKIGTQMQQMQKEGWESVAFIVPTTKAGMAETFAHERVHQVVRQYGLGKDVGKLHVAEPMRKALGTEYQLDEIAEEALAWTVGFRAGGGRVPSGAVSKQLGEATVLFEQFMSARGYMFDPRRGNILRQELLRKGLDAAGPGSALDRAGAMAKKMKEDITDFGGPWRGMVKSLKYIKGFMHQGFEKHALGKEILQVGTEHVTVLKNLGEGIAGTADLVRTRMGKTAVLKRAKSGLGDILKRGDVPLNEAVWLERGSPFRTRRALQMLAEGGPMDLKKDPNRIANFIKREADLTIAAREEYGDIVPKILGYDKTSILQEYAGKTVKGSGKKVRKAAHKFMSDFLPENWATGDILHLDPHSGNIVYKTTKSGKFKFSMIDWGAAVTRKELNEGVDPVTASMWAKRKFVDYLNPTPAPAQSLIPDIPRTTTPAANVSAKTKPIELPSTKPIKPPTTKPIVHSDIQRKQQMAAMNLQQQKLLEQSFAQVTDAAKNGGKKHTQYSSIQSAESHYMDPFAKK